MTPSDWRQFGVETKEINDAYELAGYVKNFCGTISRLELVGHGASGGVQTLKVPWASYYGIKKTGKEGDIAGKLTADATIWLYGCDCASDRGRGRGETTEYAKDPGYLAKLLGHPVIGFSKGLVNWRNKKPGFLGLWTVDEFAGIGPQFPGLWIKYYPDGKYESVKNPSGDPDGAEKGKWIDNPMFHELGDDEPGDNADFLAR